MNGRQFSKDKIQNTKIIPKQLRDKRLTNGQNKRQEDTQDKVQILDEDQILKQNGQNTK